MMLRHNEVGLADMNQSNINVSSIKRKTCQIEDFCFNCNVKDKYNTSDLETATIAAIQRNDRNLIEMEGAGVPLDLLEESKWNRIISSLYRPCDIPFLEPFPRYYTMARPNALPPEIPMIRPSV